MYLRIYTRVWLSCVVLAGCVRAAEDVGAPLVSNGVESESGGVAEAAAVPGASAAGATSAAEDAALASDRDLFIDDEGVGEGSGGGALDPDLESSGSGWGPDDEDARSGSGAGPLPDADQLPTDDEDYPPAPTLPPAPPLRPDPPLTSDTPLVLSSPRPRAEVRTRVGFEEAPVEAGAAPGAGAAGAAGAGATGSGAEAPAGGAGSRAPDDDIHVREDDKSQEEGPGSETRPSDNVVFIMNTKAEDRATSFFAQPGILAAVIGGAVVGLLCAILVVMFIVYRMRKKDEGSYALDEPKRSPAAASYGKGHNNREFYA